MGDAAQLLSGLRSFDAQGIFTEDDYAALKRIVSDIGRVEAEVLDGFIGLFFERHVLDDTRRGELLAMSAEDLERAVRHRFKQTVAGGQDSYQAWHALSAHVRDALEVLIGPGRSGWPSSITTKQGFSAINVEQAVASVWNEFGRRPSPKEATSELFTRYVSNVEVELGGSASREFPQAIVARLDAQRLARGIIALLSDDEKDLLRSQIDGVAIDTWAINRGVSRATAYRMLARLKSLCRLEFEARSRHTVLEVLDVLRDQLIP
jgi:hypothetical protein